MHIYFFTKLCFCINIWWNSYYLKAGLVDWVVNSGQLKQNSSSGDKGSDRSTTGGKSNDNDSIDESMDKTDNSESGQSPVRVIKKKRRDIPAEEKKICLWVLEDGTACGKTFTKFDRYSFNLCYAFVLSHQIYPKVHGKFL